MKKLFLLSFILFSLVAFAQSLNYGNEVLYGTLQLKAYTATTVPYLDSTSTFQSSLVTPTELGFVHSVTSSLCGINQSCTLTNKTLTAPSISSPTGIVKGDVGLGNVDNTSDATKNSATATLTNKTLTTPIIDVIKATEQASSPSTPSAGTKDIYCKTDGTCYTKNSSGVETPLGSGSGGSNFANLITNGDFSQTTTGWTASGGTFTTVSSGTNYMGVGVNNATWDSSAAAQTLTSPSYTIAGGYAGTNGLYRCKVWNQSGATITMGVWDGTTLKDSIAIDPGTTPKYVEIMDSFGAAATTTAIRFTSVTSNEPLISIADCYIGVNFEASSGVVMTDWQSYTPTFSGLGTVTGISMFWRRNGSDLELRGAFTLGTVAASLAQITLPTGLTTSSTMAPLELVGDAARSQGAGTSYFRNTILASPTSSFLSFGGQLSTVAALFAANGSTVFGTGDTIGIRAKVPIAGWTATATGVRVDNTPGSWAGYHDSNCTWSTTSTTFADPAGDSTCTFTELSNVNFGTVSSFTVSGNNAPGIVFTPRMSGRYWACASMGMLGNSGVAGLAAAKLVDGNGIEMGGTGTMSQPSSGGIAAQTCGFINVSQGVSATIKLQIAASANTTNIGNNAVTGSRTVYWNIMAVGQNLPQPMFTGTVFSSTGGQERIERAYITNSGTPTVTTQSGNWISSLTKNSTGDVTINIQSGYFSNTPACTCTVIEASTSSNVACTAFSVSATAPRFMAYAATNGTRFDRDMNIICMGPR